MIPEKSNALGLLFFLFCTLFVSCSGGEESRLSDAIRETGKLELIEMEEESTFVIRGKEWKDINSIEEGLRHLSELLKPGERIGVYSFRSYAVAYIDLTLFRDEDLSLSEDEKTATLTLPAVQVESIGRSTTINVLHERVSGSQAQITPEEKKALQDRASALFLDELKPGAVLHDEMKRKGEEKAAAFFRGLLRANGFDGVEIAFSDREEGEK